MTHDALDFLPLKAADELGRLNGFKPGDGEPGSLGHYGPRHQRQRAEYDRMKAAIETGIAKLVADAGGTVR